MQGGNEVSVYSFSKYFFNRMVVFAIAFFRIEIIPHLVHLFINARVVRKL